ncbi:MAG: low molecular weight phosphatase family protein [Candidatus Latescibacterota bacterium]|nr:MAG: low molecular weight phosphatase family protein [Candidatus Latescibacterota bacterium]
MKNGNSEKKKVLFVCIGNMIRSQMAEGFAREGGSAFIETFSAGVKPTGVVSEEAVVVMREKGIDISDHRSKGLDDVPVLEMDYIVNMSGYDLKSLVPSAMAGAIIDWHVEDPLGRSLQYFRETRDNLEPRINEFLRQLWQDKIPG